MNKYFHESNSADYLSKVENKWSSIFGVDNSQTLLKSSAYFSIAVVIEKKARGYYFLQLRFNY